MKPLISRGVFARITAGMTDTERAELAANVEFYADPDLVDRYVGRDLVHISPPPRSQLGREQIHVDQERIKDRFLELLAEQQGMVPSERARPAPRQRGAEPAFTAVDETSDRALARWSGGRQSGKVTEMQRWADEMEKVTGVRPTTVSAHRRPGQEMPQPWKDAGCISGGGQVWTAPVGTPVPDPAERHPAQWLDVDEITGEVFAEAKRDSFRRECLNGWRQEPESDRLREIRRACREAVFQLADEAGIPRHLLSDPDEPEQDWRPRPVW